MKKVQAILGSLILVLVITIVYFFPSQNENKNVITNTKNTPISKGISMMVETEAGSGNYQESEDSGWPGEGYVFNTELSKCENGGTLTWNDTTKMIELNAATSDKCYVYFDVVPPVETFSEQIKAMANSDSSILLHDSSLVNGANDNSYRYTGANPNNYICFGSNETPCPDDNLYRIIGVFGEQLKLIKFSFANKNLLGTNGAYSKEEGSNSIYFWNGNESKGNDWTQSLLNTINLNTNYLNSFSDTWKNKIAETTWQVGGMYSSYGYGLLHDAYEYELGSKKLAKGDKYDCTISGKVVTNGCTLTNNSTESSKIGLMYVSDYGYASIPEYWTTNLGSQNSTNSENWMRNGGKVEITLTPSLGSQTCFNINMVGGISNIISSSVIRPVFYLNNDIVLESGTGIISDPYRIT